MMASGGEQGGSFNPFRNKKKEDAAKKALQEMFQGKQDMLAAYDDAGGGGSGKGGKGGRGGGDGEGGGGFNFREWSAKFFRDLGGGAKSVLQTVAALLLMLSVFYAASFVRPLSAAALNAVRYILRLDGGARRGSAAAPATAAVGSEGSGLLGSNERSVISKYGADEGAEEAGEDDADEGDEE